MARVQAADNPLAPRTGRLVVTSTERRDSMGQPVVHFEVIGRDGPKLQSYYAELFGWEIDADNPMKYGIVAREPNVSAEGVGIGGDVGPRPERADGHRPCYRDGPGLGAAP